MVPIGIQLVVVELGPGLHERQGLTPTASGHPMRSDRLDRRYFRTAAGIWLT
jgi:hypothetical protein